MGNDERGQAVPLALAVIVVAVLAMVALAQLGGHVVDAARARTAADAAALAGVEGGHDAAARAAAGNGAVLVAWSSEADGAATTVRVTVRVGRASATAAASNRGP
jgi:hypothetical protein